MLTGLLHLDNHGLAPLNAALQQSRKAGLFNRVKIQPKEGRMFIVGLFWIAAGSVLLLHNIVWLGLVFLLGGAIFCIAGLFES